MIKLEHTVLASDEQMNFVIEGMRNPMNSWASSDSVFCNLIDSCGDCDLDGTDNCSSDNINNYAVGPKDYSLMQRLAKAGTDHRKFMRMIPVFVRVTAPLYW